MLSKKYIFAILFLHLFTKILLFSSNEDSFKKQKEIKKNITVLRKTQSKYANEKEFMKKAMKLMHIHPIPKVKSIPKISVVIPAFNVNKLILETITSIQNQNFSDFEVIIIEDCSTDSTYQTVLNFSKNDPRISIYKNERNRGTLHSIWKGISISKGKYMLISDADNLYTSADVFDYLFKKMEETKVDLIHFSIIQGNNLNSLSYNKFASPKTFGIITQPELRHYNSKYHNGYYYFARIFKTSIIKHISDYIGDEYLNLHILNVNDKIIVSSYNKFAETYLSVEKICFFYRMRSGSIVSEAKSAKGASDIINVLNFLYDKSRETPEDKVDFCHSFRLFSTSKVKMILDSKSEEKIELLKKFCIKHKNNPLLSEYINKKILSYCAPVYSLIEKEKEDYIRNICLNFSKNNEKNENMKKSKNFTSTKKENISDL